MSFACRICENRLDNRIHRAHEMMFGMRDEFEYLECAACGTLQIIEIPDLSRFYPAEYYSFDVAQELGLSNKLKSRLAARLAANYFNNRRNYIGKHLAEKKPWIKIHFPAYLRQFKLGINLRSRILDFGCGTGRLLHTLRYFGFRNLTGADAFIEKDIFYPNGVKIYKRRLEELEPFFDFVMLHHSFEHLPNPLETLRETHRLLRKNKFCLIRIPVVNYAWEKYGVNWVQLDPPRHLFLFTEKSLGLLAEKAGFTIEKIIYDSESFQFWGSEQYLQGVPLNDMRSYKGDISKSIFTAEQIADWEKQAEELNAKNRGDQACFYLRKTG
jgi:SAM-dependent methyltransferase